MLELLLIAAVGLLVGVINGMAGGASVISFPVLLATGISPVLRQLISLHSYLFDIE